METAVHTNPAQTQSELKSINQGLVKGVKFCFRNLYLYILHGESTSTASQLTSPASQKSKDLNKVWLLLQDLAINPNIWELLNVA